MKRIVRDYRNKGLITFPEQLDMKMGQEKQAFTMIELVVVILIIGVLVAVVVPILRGRTRQAAWSEAAATAGSIRQAVRSYYAENPAGATALAGSTVDTIQETLGFFVGDLTGRYFQAGNFTITSVDVNGQATITVVAPAGLSGSAVLNSAGWVYTP
jgi:prepilin-type N-terminal cleavage/methylation domain-containing protein